MKSASPNPPKDHHYIPQFMLDAWVDEKTEKLKRYARPHKEVTVRDAGTRATGFQEWLYTLPGVAVEHAQVLETEFFQKIDSDAAKVHVLLREGNLKGLTSEQKVIWARFVLLMLFRTPRNLAAFKLGFKGAFNQPTPGSTAAYEALKQPGHPDTAEEFIAQYHSEIVDYLTMREFPRIAQSGPFGQHFLGMLWRVFRVDPEDCSFVISDEPIVMQSGLAKPGGHLAFPLGPDAMFLATHDDATFRTIANMRPRDIVKTMNKLQVQRANCFVGAQDLSHDAFIRKHFGTKTSDTIATLFAAEYGQKPLP